MKQVFKQISQFLNQGARFLLGLGLFLIVGVFVLILQAIFMALSVPCTACVDLSDWLNQVLTLLTPALAFLTGGFLLRGQGEQKQK